MTDEQRWQRWKIAFAAGVVLTVGGMAVALVTKSVAGVMVVVGLTPLLMILLVVTMPRRNVPPYLQGLDQDQRRLVSALANSGARAPDPVLVEFVAAHARRQRTRHIVFLVSGAPLVALRLVDLLTGEAGGAGGAFDAVLVVGWLVIAGFLTRDLVRITRTISANR